MRGDFVAPRQNKHQSKERTVAMTDAEFINESLQLKEKIVGLKGVHYNVFLLENRRRD